MQPEQVTIYRQTPGQRNNYKRALVVMAVIVAVGIIALLWLLRSNATFQTPLLYKTGLNDTQNFAHIQGPNIYAYNGLSFYKLDRSANNKITVLQTGLKLPTPERIYWADDHGALITFKESFLSTAVEKALQAQGLSVDDATSNYTWYVDFASGELREVSQLPVQQDLIHYEPSENGFYYVTTNSIRQQRLHFYNIQTNHDDLSLLLDMANASSMQPCSGNLRICLVGYKTLDQQNQNLYGVTKANKLEQLYASPGLIITTNATDKVVVAQLNPDSEDEDVHVEGGPASLYNVREKSLRKLGFDIKSPESMVHFLDANNFYVLDFDTRIKNLPTYTSVTVDSREHFASKTTLLTFGDGTPFVDSILEIDQGSNNDALLTSSSGEQFLFSTVQSNIRTMIKDKSTVEKAIKNCTISNEQSSQYFDDTHTFRIILNTDSFDRKIKLFGECMQKSESTVVFGYNYTFAGADPFNGRLVTD